MEATNNGEVIPFTIIKVGIKYQELPNALKILWLPVGSFIASLNISTSK